MTANLYQAAIALGAIPSCDDCVGETCAPRKAPQRSVSRPWVHTEWPSANTTVTCAVPSYAGTMALYSVDGDLWQVSIEGVHVTRLAAAEATLALVDLPTFDDGVRPH